MQQLINIYPVLVTWKKSKKTGLCPLHLSIDINNKRAAFPSLKRKILPEQWDDEKKRVKTSVPNSALINALITKRKTELDGEFMRKQLMGVKVTKQGAKKQAKGTSTGTDFYKFCRDQIENTSRFSPETKRTYRSEVTKLEQYTSALTFNDIDFTFLQGYERWMVEERGNHPNTVWKSFKFMHGMIEIAMQPSFRLIADNPFAEYNRGTYEQGIPDYLEWHEVELLLSTLRGTEKHLEPFHRLVGYYFLLSCYAGFRFGDCVKFNFNTYVTNGESGPRLILSTAKSGESVSIAFTDHIAEVVEYIKDKPIRITNQDFNKILKVVGPVVGINRTLKHHMGRHSFGMRLAELGFSIDDAQLLLGHKDKKSTKIYFKIKNARLDNAMKTAWKKQPHE